MTDSPDTRKKRRGPRRIEVEVVGLGPDLAGVALHADPARGLPAARVLVPGAFPGDRVAARIVSRQKGRFRALPIEVLRPSPARVVPPCPVAGECGGCPVMALAPREQLAAKTSALREALIEAGMPPEELSAAWREPAAAPRALGYRNKADFVFGRGRRGELALGLYRPRSHELVPLSGCPVQGPGISRVFPRILETLRRDGLTAWPAGSPALRYLVLRESFATGEILVGLVAGAPVDPGLAERLAALDPGVAGVLASVNRSPGNRILGEPPVLLWGRDHLVERLGDALYRVSFSSFFQSNPEQAARLVREVAEALADAGARRVVDAYAGVGTFGLAAARVPGVERVWLIESEPSSCSDARENARTVTGTGAGIEVIASRAEDALAGLLTSALPDALVLDPPRAGCAAPVLDPLRTAPPETVVYVSCSPRSLARDLARIRAASPEFRLALVRAYDFFPHTPHVETLVVLRRG